MSPRQPFPLPLGGGLDRDTGPMAVSAELQEDLRNVHLTAGLALLRKGSIAAEAFVDPDDSQPMTSVLAGELLKVQNIGVIVCWREDTREVHVFRVTRAGVTATHVGVWFTLATGATEPPRVFMAEMAGRMFLAHDEPTLALRAVTVHYTPSTGDLVPLTAAWAHATTIDPAGAENALRFWPKAAVDQVVTVTYVDPGGVSASLSIDVTGTDITVNLGRTGSAIDTTAAALKAAIEADEAASALVGVAIDPDDGGLGDGSGLVTAMAQTTIAVDGIRFRGVEAHLGAYLAGWGYGSEAEARPDLVRMSLPGEPTVFELRHYESIGQPGEPVLRCLSTNRTLLCFKPLEGWDHFGSDRRNFGKRQFAKNVGIQASRLGIVVDPDGQGSDICFVWTHLGPRIATTGGFVDLESPLALDTPEPADLAELGDPEAAFAAYLPSRQQVRFHFGQRYYAYDLKEKAWSYGELAFTPSAAILLPGVASASVPPGYASDLEVTSDIQGASTGERDVTLQWTNNGMVGDEILELWMKVGAGAWTLIESVAVSAGATQTHLFEDLDAGTAHEFQIRASRGGEVRTEYESANPDDWPATSLLAYEPDMPTPALSTTGWARTSATDEEIALSFSGHDASRQTQVLRKRPAGAFEVVTTLAAGVSTYDYPVVQPDDDELLLEFKVRQVTDGGTGPDSDTESVFAGLPALTNLAQVDGPDWYEYEVSWDAPYSGAVVRVQDDYLCDGVFVDAGVTAADATGHTVTGLTKNSAALPNGNLTVQVSVRARQERTWFTVTDVSAYASIEANVDIANDETAHNSCP